MSGGASSADDLVDHFDQLGWIKGLHEPAGGAGCSSGLLHLVAAFCGQDQDRCALELGVLAQLLCEVNAVHTRHVLVSDHEVEVVNARLFVGVLAIHGFDDVEAGVLEGEGHHLAHGRGIVNNKDAMHRSLLVSTQTSLSMRSSKQGSRKEVK